MGFCPSAGGGGGSLSSGVLSQWGFVQVGLCPVGFCPSGVLRIKAVNQECKNFIATA